MCDFCEGKIIKGTSHKGNIMPMRSMLNNLFGVNMGKDEPTSCIFLDKSDNMMGFDNSDGEYATLFVNINYCPLCGVKLEEGADD